MKLQSTVLGLLGSLAIAGAAHAETPLFNIDHTASVLGANAHWTAVSFADLSAIGPARFRFSLLAEQTSAAATQSFSVNGHVVFKGSDTPGTVVTLYKPFTLDSIAFDSNVGGLHSVSSLAGNTPTIDHSGAYQLYQSTLGKNTFAFAYEDDFRARSKIGGDFNDMVVRVSVSAVPEPESYALLLAGIAAVGFVVRRSRAE